MKILYYNPKIIWIIIIILTLIVWKCTKTYETFAEPNKNWMETLNCLGFDNDDLNEFHQHLLKGEEPSVALNRLFYIAEQKGINEDKIMHCLLN